LNCKGFSTGSIPVVCLRKKPQHYQEILDFTGVSRFLFKLQTHISSRVQFKNAGAAGYAEAF
jgi:hypothetical protein